MARTFSSGQRLFPVGTFGPYPVDRLSNAQVDALEFTMAVGPDWPADRSVPVCRVTLVWDAGGGARWSFGGGPRAPDGTALTTIRERVSVPLVSDGAGGAKRGQVGGGDITLEVYTPITTTVTLAGVKRA